MNSENTTEICSGPRVFSALQEAIFEDVATGTGHTLVLARAGSGKSTTIEECLKRVPRGLTIIMVAFNQSIKLAFQKRAPKGVEVKTLHGHGLSACKRAYPNAAVDEKKSIRICCELFGDDAEERLGFRYGAVMKLVKVAKDTLTARSSVRAALAMKKGTVVTAKDPLFFDQADLDAMDELVDAFQIDYSDSDDPDLRVFFVACALRVLCRSAQLPEVIDFEDMCWMPLARGFRIWQFDRVFVDEFQDLSPCQHLLVQRMVKKGGRICAVGDDRQCIYAFRGADVDGIEAFRRELKAKVLPLSITYRCARSIVRLANAEVPDLEAAPHAGEGVVRSDVAEAMVGKAQPGDMVVSRANAPLVSLCLSFWKAGKPAAIMGRDVGENIVRLIERSKAKSVEALEEWIDKWASKEAARCLKKGRDPQAIEDQRDCILALIEGAESVADVRSRATTLFTAKDEAERVTLGTTHKLKGGEAGRVWMLVDTYRRDKGGEEANLWYVAVTRAKHELVCTTGPKQVKEAC